METRTERYTRYRENIKNMAHTDFPQENGEAAMEATPSGSAISIGGNQTAEYAQSVKPYRAYLKRRRRWLIAKLVLAAAVIAGVSVWWVLLLGR